MKTVRIALAALILVVVGCIYIDALRCKFAGGKPVASIGYFECVK